MTIFRVEPCFIVDCSLLLDCHYLKTQIILICLLLTLKQITAIGKLLIFVQIYRGLNTMPK